jgi:hypothetical protein
VKQITGTCTVTYNSALVQGSGTRFMTQLNANELIVLRGQTYRIVQVFNDTTMYVQPAYRGTTASYVIITKTVDTRVPQSQWSIDKCDGTGKSRYTLDVTKIQTAYIDYSWYGAGKIRFGFKDAKGDARYVHEFIHNNIMTEAFIRSGNLPCRYEVMNTGRPTYVPALLHWGTSVIMEGRFDDDKAYMFTTSGYMLSYTNDDPASFTATVNTTDRSLNRLYVSTYTNVQNIRANTILVSSGYLSSFTKLVRIERVNTAAYMYLDKPPLVTSTTAFTVYVGTSSFDSIPALIPIVSLRLAPSVDNGRTGFLGNKDIINRMQVHLKNVGVLASNDTEFRLYLNATISNTNWTQMTQPSLSQLVYHGKNETIEGGTNIFAFRIQGGMYSSTTSLRALSAFTQPLTDLLSLGNSIQGGDGVYPDGPDVVTVCAVCKDFVGVANTNPYVVSARLTWSESQA